MNNELKPCPFCGNSPEFDTTPINEFFIHCPGCNAEGFPSNDLKDAVYFWNSSARKLDEIINRCPVCGAVALDTWTKWGWAVECSKCFNATGGYLSLPEARKEWNRRVTS